MNTVLNAAVHAAATSAAELGPQWQTLAAVAIAASCGAWVLWRLVRPFIGRVVGACGGTTNGGGKDGSCAGTATDEIDLIQIEPAQPGSAHSSITRKRSH